MTRTPKELSDWGSYNAQQTFAEMKWVDDSGRKREGKVSIEETHDQLDKVDDQIAREDECHRFAVSTMPLFQIHGSLIKEKSDSGCVVAGTLLNLWDSCIDLPFCRVATWSKDWGTAVDQPDANSMTDKDFKLLRDFHTAMMKYVKQTKHGQMTMVDATVTGGHLMDSTYRRKRRKQLKRILNK